MTSTIERTAASLIVISWLGIGGGCANELAMIEMDGMDLAVKSAAARDHAWDPSDVRVGVVADLGLNGCSFFRASNSSQMDRQPVEYVVLPDGELVGARTNPSAASAILRACGKDAPADWWTQVITRFSDKVRGVVVDPKNAPSALRKIREAGAEWAPPNLTKHADSTTVTFFTIAYEEGVPYEVTAVLTATGTLTVDTRKLSSASQR